MFESSLNADAIFIKWVPRLFSLGIHMMTHKHMLENVDKRRGRTFIPPFDHPDVITGQGIIGMEIMRQIAGPGTCNLCTCERWRSHSWYYCLCEASVSRGQSCLGSNGH